MTASLRYARHDRRAAEPADALGPAPARPSRVEREAAHLGDLRVVVVERGDAVVLGRELVGVLVEPDVELAAELVELHRAVSAARRDVVATLGPVVPELLGDLAAAPHALDLTAGDLHPERRAAAELQHLDAVGSGLVRVRGVGGNEEAIAGFEHLRAHLQRAADHVVEAVTVVGVARQHVVRAEPGTHEAHAVVAFAAVDDLVEVAVEEVGRTRTVGRECGAVVGVELGCAHRPRLEEAGRVLAAEQLDALLVGHAVIVAHRRA